MGITERKKREKKQRRNDIIDAAERVFFSKGISNATMDDVAETAELSKGTLYLYFKSKEELYLAVNLRGLEILESLFKEAAGEHRIGLKKVHAIGRAYHRFYKEYPDYFNALLFYDSHAIDSPLKDTVLGEVEYIGRQCLQILVESINTGIADRSIRPDIDPMKTATILWGLTTGIIQLIATKGEHLKNQHGLRAGELVDDAFALIEKALQKSK